MKVVEAIEYIKGYCDKHTRCEDYCRLFNHETNQCFFLDCSVPCDWAVEDNGQENE